MKKILVLVFSVLVSLSLFIIVYADESDPDIDIGGGSGPSGQTGGGATFKYNNFAGIRFSLVKSDGTDVGSQNYIADSIYNQHTSRVAKMTSGKCSRAAYANGKCSINWNGGTSLGSVPRLSTLQSLFTVNASGKSFTFPVELSHKVNENSRSYTGIFDGLKYENNTKITKEEHQEFINAFLEQLLSTFNGGNIEDYVVKGEKNKLYDLFIVIEPLELVKINGQDYVGTSYELAAFAYTQKGGGFVNSNGERPCSTTSNGALCDLGASLRKGSPCKTYLDGNIIDSLKEKESTILINNFPDGYYFKNVQLVYSHAQTKCSGGDSSRIDVNIATNSNYGVGMGVVWISDVYDGDNLTCDSIKESIGWDASDEAILDSAFKSGGIQAIYNLYPSGVINFLDGSDSIDAKWFINRCTCYGVYDHYANNNIVTYKNQNQTQINTISNAFGSSNWFQVPQLWDTKAWLISEKLESNFTSFNDQWQKYSESIGLEWTPITGDEYVESLKCGTHEEYWCDEFENWYEEQRRNYSSLSRYPSINTIKNSSISIINNRYKDQLQTMIDAYNLNFYPANGFKWTLDLNDSTSGITTYSYITHCIDSRAASCTTVKNFYSGIGIDLDSWSCEKLGNYSFPEYNNKYPNANITGDWYVSVCGCNQALSFDCTPDYNVGSCTNGEEITYTDSSSGVVSDEYWDNCVFEDYGKYDIDPHKVSDKTDALTYYESELGSKYCEVYCIEDLSANLASPNVYVEAGSRFEWGYSNVRGSRTCKTKSVEWDQFEDDLKRVNQEIVEEYAQMKVEEKANQVSWSSSRNCSTCCISWDYDPCDTDGDGVNDSSCRGDCNICGTRYVPSTYSVSFTATANTNLGPFESTKTVNLSANCSGPQKFSASSGPYLSSITEAKGYVEQMKLCYTWDESKVYEVDPQATIIYSDDINYYYTDELDKSTSYSFSDDSVCVSDIAEPITSCSGSTCRETTYQMKNCSGDDRYVEMTRSASTNFYLKDIVYRYVLKSNHLSIHSDDLGSGISNQGYLSGENYIQGLKHVNIDSNFVINFIDIGVPNFPVSFSAPDGVYGTYEGRGQLDVEYNTLGHVENNSTMVDTILGSGAASSLDSDEYGKWICEYTVYSDLLPEDDPGKDKGGIGDIDVIYRPIDLENPFPDTDASGRDTGDNWCDLDSNCSNTNNYVKDFIHNNRNVAYEEVYNLEPMYTFVLTPAIIKEIRKYNDENSYTSYTGSLGTTQYFDYKCNEGTGNGCVSDYLSYLIDITGAKNRPGVCVDDKFRNSNDPNSFYSCKF